MGWDSGPLPLAQAELLITPTLGEKFTLRAAGGDRQQLWGPRAHRRHTYPWNLLGKERR